MGSLGDVTDQRSVWAQKNFLKKRTEIHFSIFIENRTEIHFSIFIEKRISKPISIFNKN